MRYSRDESEFDRAFAFIDATFAVALTLLVTGLDVDDTAAVFADPSSLFDAIGAQFIAIVIAFLVIAGYWLMNHRMAADFVAIDSRTIVVNLGLVGAIVLLPFSTASVGDPSAEGLTLPTVLMAVNIAAISGLQAAVWVSAYRGDLFRTKPTEGEAVEQVVNACVPAAVFMASVPIAYLASPELARLSWVSLAFINPLVGGLTARFRRTHDER